MKIIDLGSSKSRYSILKIIKIIYELKPDVVLSILSHLNILLALIKPFLPKDIEYIARESTIVSIDNKNSKYGNFLNYLYKNVYNRFYLIITQSKYMERDLIHNFNLDENKIQVINNSIDSSKILRLATEKFDLFNPIKFNLLIFGTLSEVKKPQNYFKYN